ncbi:hypothetical protein CA11_29110 [Gimesia maris]|nr:hypothetical protein CA11_29110 [Gimesia maris]
MTLGSTIPIVPSHFSGQSLLGQSDARFPPLFVVNISESSIVKVVTIRPLHCSTKIMYLSYLGVLPPHKVPKRSLSFRCILGKIRWRMVVCHFSVRAISGDKIGGKNALLNLTDSIAVRNDSSKTLHRSGRIHQVLYWGMRTRSLLKVTTNSPSRQM